MITSTVAPYGPTTGRQTASSTTPASQIKKVLIRPCRTSTQVAILLCGRVFVKVLRPYFSGRCKVSRGCRNQPAALRYYAQSVTRGSTSAADLFRTCSRCCTTAGKYSRSSRRPARRKVEARVLVHTGLCAFAPCEGTSYYNGAGLARLDGSGEQAGLAHPDESGEQGGLARPSGDVNKREYALRGGVAVSGDGASSPRRTGGYGRDC